MSVRRIPTTIAGAVHKHVLAYGELDVETGLFLLAPLDADTVSTVAFAGSSGVTRQRGRFEVSGTAISRLFRHLGDRELVVLAQAHSHRGAAGLSRTDLDHGFSVEGFTTAVIPNYRRPPHDPRDWGWWRYDHGRWLSIAPYELDSVPGAIACAEVLVTTLQRGLWRVSIDPNGLTTEILQRLQGAAAATRPNRRILIGAAPPRATRIAIGGGAGEIVVVPDAHGVRLSRSSIPEQRRAPTMVGIVFAAATAAGEAFKDSVCRPTARLGIVACSIGPVNADFAIYRTKRPQTEALR